MFVTYLQANSSRRIQFWHADLLLLLHCYATAAATTYAVGHQSNVVRADYDHLTMNVTMAGQKMHKNNTNRMQRLSWHCLPTHTHTHLHIFNCNYIGVYMCVCWNLFMYACQSAADWMRLPRSYINQHSHRLMTQALVAVIVHYICFCFWLLFSMRYCSAVDWLSASQFGR